jgi:hypothetical protein
LPIDQNDGGAISLRKLGRANFRPKELPVQSPEVAARRVPRTGSRGGRGVGSSWPAALALLP